MIQIYHSEVKKMGFRWRREHFIIVGCVVTAIVIAVVVWWSSANVPSANIGPL